VWWQRARHTHSHRAQADHTHTRAFLLRHLLSFGAPVSPKNEGEV
jgi:hypothetical protein